MCVCYLRLIVFKRKRGVGEYQRVALLSIVANAHWSVIFSKEMIGVLQGECVK